MRHRSPLHTAFAALLGVWFVLSGALLSAGNCAMHARPAAHIATAPSAPAGMAHGVHDAHTAHGAHGMPGGTSAPDDAPVHGCTCLSDCCSTGAVAVVAPVEPPARAPMVVTVVASVSPRVLRIATGAAAHLLPFANGPPSGAHA